MMFVDFFFAIGLFCYDFSYRDYIWVCLNADVVKVDVLGM